MRFLAVLIARLAAFVSRLAGNAGTSLPGMWATKIDRKILTKLGREVSQGIIVVTGTNGKTTTANIVTQFLEAEGYSVICNNVGSNMYNGVVSAFLLNASLSGKICANYAVLEVDELYTVQICKELMPDVFVVTNLYPDQADRFGSVEEVREVLERAIGHAKPDATLILNADNPDSAVLQTTTSREVAFFGMKQPVDYHAIKIVGPDRLGLRVEANTGTVDMMTNLRGDYNISNILAAVAIAHRMGITLESCAQTLDSIQAQPGRMERFIIDEKPVVINMAKNPAGFNRTLDTIREALVSHDVLLVVNNTPADGVDIDWYRDIEFERFDSDLTRRFFIGGSCAEAMMARLKKAGVEEERIHIVKDLTSSITRALDGKGEALYVISNYTATFPLRKELVSRMTMKG